MRDTVGAIHNLSHLLGSVRVGPKALARVIPDVHASCAPMIAAAGELLRATKGGPLGTAAVSELEELIVARMRELERALGRAKRTGLRASERLSLETALSSIIRDLDGALGLLELLVEASATGSVPVDVVDVIRESAARMDVASRNRKLTVSFTVPAEPVSVKVNPRLAMRLFAYAAALSAGPGANVRADIEARAGHVRLSFAAGPAGSETVALAIPALIPLSAKCAAELARTGGAVLEPDERGSGFRLTLPLAAAD
jgi:hypothetical protein